MVAGRPSVTTRERIVCDYCLGRFMPSRSDAVRCSDACRKAVSRALQLETWAHVDPPSIRSEHWSSDRAAATGCGSLTRREAYLADLRVRLLAGLDQVEHPDQREALAALEK
jgi:hypothetical protein